MVVSARVMLFLCMANTFFFFLRQRDHFLAALLLLELIAIFLVLVVPILGVSIGQSSLVVVLVILTIRACEARLGLAVLVYMIRLYGNDIMRSVVIRSF